MFGSASARDALVVCFVGALAATCSAQTFNVVMEPGTTHEVDVITGYATTGADMDGMLVTARFADGFEETVIWEDAFLPLSGKADGNGWLVFVIGDTHVPPRLGTWEIKNFRDSALKQLTFDGVVSVETGEDEEMNVIFDVNWPNPYGDDGSNNDEGTPGTSSGRTFKVILGPSEMDITATYRNEVALAGEAPVGDIFEQLDLVWNNKSGLARNKIMVMRADTDTAEGGQEVSGECRCYWENGESLAKFDGQQSFINGYEYPDDPRGHEEARAADDFYLEKGSMYQVEYFEVTMITNFVPDQEYETVCIELYRDCDGRPAEEPFLVIDETQMVEFGELLEADGYLSTWIATGENLWLEGNTQYWIVALGKNRYFDEQKRWYFATAPEEPVRCAPSVARDDIADTVLPDEWTPSPRINLHCQELAFRVCAEACPIVCDTGDFDYDGIPSIADTTVPEARGADNFVLNPCWDYEVCFAQGYVATNCNPWNGVLEIYTNECDIDEDDDGRVGDTVGSPVGVEYVSNVIDTGETVEINGKVLNIYCLQFCAPAPAGPGDPTAGGFPLYLPGNQNYWISIVNRGTGSFNERGYTLFNYDCRRDCQIKISQARFRSPGAGIPEWIPIQEVSALGPRDLSFLVAARAAPSDGADPMAVTGCWVDVNGDGVVNTLDVGAFLNAYGQGCVAP